MSDILLLLTGAILVNNFVLTQTLGVCSFMGTSGKRETAVAMAVMTTLVTTLSSILIWPLYHYVLQPFDLVYLRTVACMLVIAVLVSCMDFTLHKLYPLLHRALGIFVLLLATNCAVLGVALLNEQASRSLLESVLLGFGAAAGFSLVLVLFATLRERLQMRNIPAPLRGSGIAMITAGLMSLAFMGFAGLV